jgi:hypothetical protein
MSDLSAEERAQQLVDGNNWRKSDPWNFDVEFGNPPEVDEARLVQFIAAAIRDSERAAARRERARCASIADEHQRRNTPPGSEGWNIAGAIAGDIRALPDD